MPVQRPARESRFRHDVVVVGLGYVGLPTALALQATGSAVLGLEISTQRLEEIRSGAADLLPSDQARLRQALTAPDSFTLTTDATAMATAEVVLVCVPTPIDHYLAPDLDALRAACRSVVAQVVAGQTIVLTSTTYVGCTREFLVEPLRARGFEIGTDVFVAFAPERIDPGNDQHVQKVVPRVVGGVTEECVRRAARLLEGCSSFVHPVSSVEVAEMTKLYENTFRAVNISMANEFADISRGLGLDVTEVIDAAATKPYGFMPFYPGPGVGGHCIPCDPHYLLWQLRADRVSSPLIETAMSQVAARPGRVVQRVVEVLADSGKALSGASVLVVGVAYKPGVADVRESPALEIIQRLRAAGASVSFTDAMIDSIAVRGGRMYSVDPVDATEWDVVLVHTLQPGTDHSWLADAPTVLDATYRLSGVPHLARL
ncbi:nucleotide sugar dehydrogenase [Actinoplanes sp. NPDC051494]|uniref:nucleotide sugar dehydrogenase n=1 Tax=Actinoplanes sp. NPDC051494 TaxID=3363907 RepID=UPI003796A3DC